MIKSVSKHFVSYIYSPAQPNKGKAIILFHGWGSSVHNYHEYATSLSALGFKVIVPEIIFHDSRGKLENHFQKEVMQEYFWKTIFRSIDESKLFFEEMSILTEDIILMGISMGGCIANGIYATGKHFAGLININGSGSFILSEKIFRENDHRPQLSRKEMEQIYIYNPIGKNICSSPILLLHGKQDSIVSIEGQKDYLNYLSKMNTHQNAEFFIYENVNHTFSEEMMEDIKGWLEKNSQQEQTIINKHLKK